MKVSIKEIKQSCIVFALAIVTVNTVKGQCTGSVTLAPTGDATTYSNSYTNVGTSKYLEVGMNSVTRNSYLKFDVSTIPKGAIIVSANLTLSVVSGGAGTTGNNSATIYTAESAWTETGIVAASNVSFGSSVGTIPAGTTDQTVDIKGVVGAWVNNQYYINRGLVVKPNNNASNYTFGSREHATVSKRPKLVVTFTVPNSVAAPNVSISSQCSNSGTPSSATLTVPNNYAATSTSYKWYTNANGTGLISNSQTVSGAGVKYGQYIITNYCGTISSPIVPVTVVDKATPAVPVITASSDFMCQGESVNLTSSSIDGFNYWYIEDDNSLNTISNTGVFVGNNPGKERVIFSTTFNPFGPNACTSTGYIDLKVGALPFEIIGSDVVCENVNSTYNVNENATGNLYTWYIKNSSSASLTFPQSDNKTTQLYSSNIQGTGDLVLVAQGSFQCIQAGKQLNRVVEKNIHIQALPPTPILKCGDANCNTIVVLNNTGAYDVSWISYNYATGVTTMIDNTSGNTVVNPKNGSVSCVFEKNGCKQNNAGYWYPAQSYPCNIVYDFNHPNSSSQNYTGGARLARAEDNSSNLSVYPNPAIDHATIKTNGEGGLVNVFNSTGTLLKVISISEGVTSEVISIKDLSAGLYIMKMYTNTNEEYITTLVVE